jgi:uncharacterized protein
MNPPLSLKAQQIAEACHLAFSELGVSVQAVYLHGSWGTGYERADSDIDLALLCQSPIDLKRRVHIEEALRRQMAVNVDIDMVEIDMADLRRTDTVFAAHVVVEGRRLLVVDRPATEQFEMLALAKYARLNEERAGILADIRARGTVYKQGVRA